MAKKLTYDELSKKLFSIKQLLNQGGEIILRAKASGLRGEE